MTIAVAAEELSKEYRIQRTQSDTMLRERLTTLVRRLRRPRAEHYESVWALRDVSFTVRRGEVLGIIGRNGAGKSTLLKLLSRITHPTRGRLQVGGRLASLLEVGTGFHDELTGRENIFLNGSIFGMTQADVRKRLDAIVAFSGVERYLDTPIKRYSSGMRVRLGFAVAAHVEPEVLIVDEVLAVGDAGFQKKCLDTMQDMRTGGRTVLFVSHQMAAVENLCSRGIWLEGGRLSMDGPVNDVISSYLSSFASNESSLALHEIEARNGNGRVRFVGVDFLDQHGGRKDVIRCGETLTIRLSYRATAAIPSPNFGVRVYTELGTLVTDASTWIVGAESPDLAPGDGYVDLEIGPLTIASGRYSLSFFLHEGAEFTLCDGLEHCAVLDLEMADVFGSGRPPHHRYGLAYFAQRWRLNDQDLPRPDLE